MTSWPRAPGRGRGPGLDGHLGRLDVVLRVELEPVLARGSDEAAAALGARLQGDRAVDRPDALVPEFDEMLGDESRPVRVVDGRAAPVARAAVPVEQYDGRAAGVYIANALSRVALDGRHEDPCDSLFFEQSKLPVFALARSSGAAQDQEQPRFVGGSLDSASYLGEERVIDVEGDEADRLPPPSSQLSGRVVRTNPVSAIASRTRVRSFRLRPQVG